MQWNLKMYIVKVKDSNEIVAICSYKEDAFAYLYGQKLDKTTYIIEETQQWQKKKKQN